MNKRRGRAKPAAANSVEVIIHTLPFSDEFKCARLRSPTTALAYPFRRSNFLCASPRAFHLAPPTKPYPRLVIAAAVPSTAAALYVI